MTKEELKEIVKKFKGDESKDTFAVVIAGNVDFTDASICLKGQRIQLAVAIGIVLGELIKSSIAAEESVIPVKSAAVMDAFSASLKKALLGDIEKDTMEPDPEADSYLDPTKPAHAPKPKTPGEKISWEETINELLGHK